MRQIATDKQFWNWFQNLTTFIISPSFSKEENLRKLTKYVYVEQNIEFRNLELKLKIDRRLRFASYSLTTTFTTPSKSKTKRSKTLRRRFEIFVHFDLEFRISDPSRIRAHKLYIYRFIIMFNVLFTVPCESYQLSTENVHPRHLEQKRSDGFRDFAIFIIYELFDMDQKIFSKIQIWIHSPEKSGEIRLPRSVLQWTYQSELHQ